MIRYDYICTKCGHEEEEWREIDKRNDPKKCTQQIRHRDNYESFLVEECGGQMKLKIGNPPFKIN